MAEKPWRTLRDRPEIEFLICDLPGGVDAIYATRGEDRAILLNRRLGAVERLAALAHELVHDERGGGCHHPDAPPLLRVLESREEARVAGLVADKLLPPARLQAYVDQRADVDETVTPWQVAEDLEVSIDIADLALQRLAAGF